MAPREVSLSEQLLIPGLRFNRAPQARGLGVKTQLPSIQDKEVPLYVKPQCHLLSVLGEKNPTWPRT